VRSPIIVLVVIKFIPKPYAPIKHMPNPTFRTTNHAEPSSLKITK